MNPPKLARPKDIPGPDGTDPREQNGTDADADEEQLGLTEEEVGDLENDAEGG